MMEMNAHNIFPWLVAGTIVIMVIMATVTAYRIFHAMEDQLSYKPRRTEHPEAEADERSTFDIIWDMRLEHAANMEALERAQLAADERRSTSADQSN